IFPVRTGSAKTSISLTGLPDVKSLIRITFSPVSDAEENQKLERDDLFWSLLVILPYTHPKQKKETCVFFRAYL
ncbi:MAG: hypothetical protein J5553_05200, partial [Verrucomicrobia bacterium]|nr:hypothetical protein [Verrucomicrobiota bacterium]